MIDDIIDLESAILALPPEDIEIMRLWASGYTLREIGEQTGYSKGALCNRIERSIAILRTKMNG